MCQPRVSVYKTSDMGFAVTLLNRDALNELRLGYVRVRLLGLQFMCECYYRDAPYPSMQTLGLPRTIALSHRWSTNAICLPSGQGAYKQTARVLCKKMPSGVSRRQTSDLGIA